MWLLLCTEFRRMALLQCTQMLNKMSQEGQLNKYAELIMLHLLTILFNSKWDTNSQ